MIKRLTLFLIVHFAALGLGSALMGTGPMGNWYQDLNKAPWTPPGWVFGAAWTLIMIFLSIAMAKLLGKTSRRSHIMSIWGVHLVLNVLWNPLFFNWHLLGIALIEILMLLGLVIYLGLCMKKEIGRWSLLILPYILWLSIAATLNGYAFQFN